VASTKDQFLFYLTKSYSKEELTAIKNKTDFFCPSCNAAVILKIGQIKTPHFAHKSLTHCDTYSEPESPLHLQGKLQLYRFFSSNNHTVELEKYLPDIRQRADLLVDQHTAIELQYSPVSAPQVCSRSQGYLRLGIQPEWIIGLPGPVEEGIQLFKLSSWKKELLRQRQKANYIISFSPEADLFYYHSNLIYISGNQWIGKVKSLAAAKQQFPFAVPRKLSEREFEEMYSLFYQARRKFIASQQFINNRIRSSFWRACYELQLDGRNLPATIGIPLKNAELIPCHPVLWQLQALAGLKNGAATKTLIETGKIPHCQLSGAKEAEALIGSYVDAYVRLEDQRVGNKVPVNLLFDCYCKSV